MESLLDAVVTIKADKSGFASAMDGIKDDVKKAEAPTTQFLSGFKKQLQDLKKEGGKSSGLGLGLQTLRGAGAVAGIALLGKALEGATAKAAELAEQFRHGETDASGLAVGIAESLPLIGHFVSAGQNIREMFTHERAELKAINDAIALGNALMAARVVNAEQARTAVQGLERTKEGFEGQLAVANAPNERERKRVDVDVTYKSNQRQIEEQTKKDIEARRKELSAQTTDIGKQFEGKESPDVLKHRDELIKSAGDSSARDIAKINTASEGAMKALDALHEKSAEDADSIKDAMQKLGNATADALAVTDPEKIDNYNRQLRETGYSAQQAGALTAVYTNQLKMEKLAEFKTSLKEMQEQILVTGETAKDSAIAKAIVQGADPAQIETFTAAYDELQHKLKARELADSLKAVNEEYLDVGKNDLDKQIAQMQRLWEKSGNVADMVGKIAEARKKLEALKAEAFIDRTDNATAKVGLSAPDKAVAELKDTGVTDKQLLGKAWAAAAKLAGAELKKSVETPFENFQDRIKELNQLKNAEKIDSKTFNRARNEAVNQYQSASGSKSIEQAFKDNLKRQFVDFGLADKKKAKNPLTEQMKKNASVAELNTKALDDLNKTLTNGVPMALA